MKIIKKSMQISLYTCIFLNVANAQTIDFKNQNNIETKTVFILNNKNKQLAFMDSQAKSITSQDLNKYNTIIAFDKVQKLKSLCQKQKGFKDISDNKLEIPSHCLNKFHLNEYGTKEKTNIKYNATQNELNLCQKEVNKKHLNKAIYTNEYITLKCIQKQNKNSVLNNALLQEESFIFT